MNPYESDIQACIKAFEKNGVILYPTDTIWGLGCRADDELAIEKIYAIKQRPLQQSFILLMTDVKQLSQYIANPQPDLEDILASFTEPTTFIYKNAINLPNAIIAADGSIAIRITKDPFCRSLIKRTKTPLVSTSANLSGQNNPNGFSEIDTNIITKVDYAVLWRQEENMSKPPSAIYSFNNDGSLIKIR